MERRELIANTYLTAYSLDLFSQSPIFEPF
jgi:hypothetical protein